MYYRHFGLGGPPFEFTASPAALYMGKEHSEALAALEWGVLNEPSGYTVFIGEPGTGKTTMVTAVLARHYESVRAVYINHPRLSFNEFLIRITRQLGIEPAQPTKLELVEAFRNYLAKLAPATRVVMVVDEAQALSDESFEELRLLANQGLIEHRHVQVILVGQPELAQRLEQPALKQLNERIGARAILHPLTEAEAREYTAHQIEARGGHIEQIFAPRALEQVIRHSRGIPRRINILCHNAMLTAFSRNAKTVSPDIMREVIAEYDNFAAESAPAENVRATSPGRIGVMARAGAMFVAVFLLGAGAVWLWQSDDVTAAARPTATDAIQASALEPLHRAPDNPSKPAIPISGPNWMTAGGDRAPAMFMPGANPPAAASSGDAAPSAKPVADSAPSRPSVTVRRGDTVTAIAARYVGSTQAVKSLKQENPQIANLDRIYPGEVIYLPPRKSAGAQDK